MASELLLSPKFSPLFRDFPFIDTPFRISRFLEIEKYLLYLPKIET